MGAGRRGFDRFAVKSWQRSVGRECVVIYSSLFLLLLLRFYVVVKRTLTHIACAEEASHLHQRDAVDYHGFISFGCRHHVARYSHRSAQGVYANINVVETGGVSDHIIEK